ncbi:MAG: radical SAM protein [Kofleriaceae bacterium]
MSTLALQAVTPAALAAAVPACSLAEARKLVAQIHRDEPVAASSSVRRTAADAVLAAGHVPSLAVDAEEASAVDPFVKYRLRTGDGEAIEAVRIPLERAGRFTVCVSSQVGCALACAFCATGRLGLRRNLAAWEIVEQVRVVRRRLPGGRIHGVVFQGMGEPMANLDAVLAAIDVLRDPCALGVDARNITVCTSGLPAGIRRLARCAPKVRLGLSLGGARPEIRRQLMPIAGAHAWADVVAACAEHAQATGLAPMWAVTLLDGVNDDVADAAALVEAARGFERTTGIRPRLSLIPYNAIGDGPDGGADPFRRAEPGRTRAFRDVLVAAGLPHHVRYSGGGDVAAACGQLAARAPAITP